MSQLPPLATLDISDAYIDRMWCLVTGDGAMDPVRFWGGMEELELSFGHLSEGLEGFGYLVGCMPGLRRLGLGHALPSGREAPEGMLRALCTLTRLTALDISAASLPLDGDTRARYGWLTWTADAGWRVEMRALAYDLAAELRALEDIAPPDVETLARQHQGIR